jgi:hypothetical protein
VPCIIQVALARAGWAEAVLQAGELPIDLGLQLQQAQREARARQLGSYSVPGAAPRTTIQALRESARDGAPVAPLPAPPAERKPNF